MSVIGITKVPVMTSLQKLKIGLTKIIRGDFEILNFILCKNKNNTKKVAYVQISEKLDPQYIVEIIKDKTAFGAFIPEHVPDLHMASSTRIRRRPQKRKNVTEEMDPEQVISITHSEILLELQSKHTGLFQLSRKTGHKLLDALAEKIFERLKQIMEKTAALTGFDLSKSYRTLHPHFGDFQLILSTLHALQDAAGAQRAQILEHQLTAVSSQPYVFDDVPYDNVQTSCAKYSKRIVNKVSEHIKGLDSQISSSDTDDVIARKRIREELKNLSPFLPIILKQVIASHFVPKNTPFRGVRIYGEPSLPNKDNMESLLKRHRAVKVRRSDRMYNLLRLTIPVTEYAHLLAMDGSVLGGAKVVIRPSDMPVYAAKMERKMASAIGAKTPVPPTDTQDVVEDSAET